MRLSAQDRRERLLEVATQLFARHGFNGTTTRQIAKLCGVTEALVFRHFRNKEQLYWAVLDRQCSPRTGRARLQELLTRDDGDDAEVFAAIGADLIRRHSEDSVLARLLLFSGLENHGLAHRFYKTYISEYYEVLAGHIRGRIESGRFRVVDPLLAARGFIGMCFYHFLLQDILGGGQERRFAPEEVSRTFAEVWLRGMAAVPDASQAATAPLGESVQALR